MSDGTETRAGQTTPGTGPCARLGAEIDNLLRTLVPSDQAVQHFTNARVEILKGVRAIIDARIEHLAAEERKGVSVRVE